MKKIEIAGEELVYETENSIYIIREESYQRLPKHEEPRYAYSEALVDGKWIPHEGVWELEEDHEFGEYYNHGLRILPAGRHKDAVGLITSRIVAKASKLSK